MTPDEASLWPGEKLAAAALRELGCRLPPVPLELAPSLEPIGDCQFSTRGPVSLYLIDDRVREYFAGVDPYVAFGISGHGFNSVGMHYLLVTPRVAIFYQAAWGGLTLAGQLSASLADAAFAQIGMIVRWLEEGAASGRGTLVVVATDFGESRWGWREGEGEPAWSYEGDALAAITQATIAVQTARPG